MDVLEDKDKDFANSWLFDTIFLFVFDFLIWENLKHLPKVGVYYGITISNG